MIVYPTVQPALKAALTVQAAAFSGVASVSAKMPTHLPAKFVRVSRVGGRRPSPVTDIARILIELFGPDPETVESMTGTADAAMLNAIGTAVNTTTWIRWWGDQQGPVDFPHPDYLSWDRWQITGDLHVSTTEYA